MPDFPRIKSKRTIPISPWMKVIEREVEFAAGAKPELYHAVGQQDYIAIVAVTTDGKIPIVREPASDPFQVGEYPVTALVTQGRQGSLEKSIVIHGILLLGTPAEAFFRRVPGGLSRQDCGHSKVSH
jgi:hypothetical protein